MNTATMKERNLIAVIGDEDSVTGILLSGVGHLDSKQRPNFLVVDQQKTPLNVVQDTFKELCKRRDIAILLINQHIAEEIRDTMEECSEGQAFPVVLEIPSKEHPYDPEKDTVLKRISGILGNE